MTPVEAVRQRLAQMRALCDPKAMYAAGMGPGPYTDLLLRLVTEAEGVLDRHRWTTTWSKRWCAECWWAPCPEVQAVLRAWAP